MSLPVHQPFRAGRAEVRAGADLTAVQLPELAGEVVRLGDVSEFQPDISDQRYLAWSKSIVIRAAYGVTPDRAWYAGARRAALHAGGAQFVGIYQYLVADQDPVEQADALGALIGALRPGEKILCDIEEGTGSQQARWMRWAGRIAQLGDDPWDYSGAFFAAEHGLQPVDWIASYGSAEPAAPHKLWQCSDAYNIPGVGHADLSIFHGSQAQLTAQAYRGAGPPKPPPPAEPELRIGATGGAVVVMQQRLNAWGASPRLATDGLFGPKAGAALRTFQGKHSLTQDGVCGPITWTLLNRTP